MNEQKISIKTALLARDKGIPVLYEEGLYQALKLIK